MPINPLYDYFDVKKQLRSPESYTNGKHNRRMDRFNRLDKQEAASSSTRYEERQGTTATIDEEDEEDDHDEEHDEDDDEWWASDSGSSSGSYYSDSESYTDSSYAEWETDIGPLGEVFYIESLSETPGSNKKPEKPESPPPELKRKRSTRAGKLMRLIRRRESKRYSTRNKKSKGDSKQEGNASKEGSKEVKFQDYQAGEIKEVMLWVDPEKRHKLGRRATLCEAYLGIVPGDFSDKVRVMVSGFIPDGEAIKNKNIKIGDWLRSIDDYDVTTENIEPLLNQISSPMSLKLQLQRVAGIEVTEDEPSSIPRQSARVRRLVDRERSKKFMNALLDYSFGVIYLQTSGLSETGPELQGVMYTYPRSENKSQNSILCSARGAFVTLNHLLPETFSAIPTSTTISVGSERIHVMYVARNDELLLLAIPERWYSLEESRELMNDIVRTLEFSYATLHKCFADEYNHLELDHMFYLAFTRLLGIDNDEDPVDDEVHQIKTAIQRREKCEFEKIVGAAQHVQLPMDAQFEIDCALNEMEAMDCREWNEDPMECQRLYTILGTCVYHKSYLLTSHIMHLDFLEVHSFLRMNGLLELMENEPVKSLVVWRLVYPKSCHRGIITDPKTQFCAPDAKWFVLVVGYETEFLVALFESGTTSQTIIEDGPDIFYVEEAQETLRHIQKVGVPIYAAKWIASNAKPETVDLKDKIGGKHLSIAENLLGLIKSSDNSNAPAKSNCGTIKKVPEVTSILKKRSPEQSLVITGSMYSFQASEESLSQGGAMSEQSDDGAPILGRRALRERYLAQSRVESDDSDSEIDMYRQDCDQQQHCPFDFTDIRESLLSQSEVISPIRITTGPKNVLIHYVHLDPFEGVLMSSRTIENPGKNADVINTFNECAHTIHKLLGNTVRFKTLAIEDPASVVINKNLVAIKEHGILFEYEGINFWVIGRLFETPCLKEFYVCYEDSVPQNLIEMAFKLQTTWH
ncbi:hypothetical protein G9C98_003450 [Cotesia typhae]|uniref:PDZ domain-containing protein n=2 Tax=Cotesia typhae TaxID=2053667 RepID=A0A8J5R5I2_9HYME|nr:hypothetical protein G9C98_003450 [Cotesia typhae]